MRDFGLSKIPVPTFEFYAETVTNNIKMKSPEVRTIQSARMVPFLTTGAKLLTRFLKRPVSFFWVSIPLALPVDQRNLDQSNHLQNLERLKFFLSKWERTINFKT